MKKLCSLILLITWTTLGFAQDEPAFKKFRFGFKASPSFNWMRANSQELDKDGLGATITLNYGLMGEFAIGESNNYMFSTGFELAANGGKLMYPSVVQIDGNDFVGKTERRHNLKYLRVPLALKMRTNEIGYLTYYGSFGVSADFNYDAVGKDEHNLVVQAGNFTEEDLDIGDDTRFFRSALVIGAGAEYRISGNTYIVGGLSFHNGFINVLKGKSLDPDENGNGQLDSSGNPIEGSDKKAITNSITLDIGVFF